MLKTRHYEARIWTPTSGGAAVFRFTVIPTAADLLTALACFAVECEATADERRREEKAKHCHVLGEFVRELELRKIKPVRGSINLTIAGTHIGTVTVDEYDVWDNLEEAVDGLVEQVVTDALYPTSRERTFVIPEGSLLDPTPAKAQGRPFDKEVGFIKPPRPSYRGEQREGEIGGSDFQ